MTTATQPRHIVEAFADRRRTEQEATTANGCIVIPDCLLLGFKSKNGRRYTEQCLQEAVPLYERASIGNNHPAPHELNQPRKNEDILGFVQNVRYDPVTGLRGDCCFTVVASLTESVKRASVLNPRQYQFSHNADWGHRSDDPDGTEVIESIARVYSVDLVQGGGTTNSLFESERRTMSKEKTTPETPTTKPPEKRTAKQVFESVFRFPKDRRILEDAGLMADVPVSAAADAPVEDQTADAFLSVIGGFMKAGEDDKAVKALRAYFKITNDTETPAEPKTATESVKVLGTDAGLRLLESEKVTPTSALLRTVARLTESEAKEFLTVHASVVNENATLKSKIAKLTDETPTSLPRITESERTPAEKPKEGEKPYSRYLVTTSNN